MEEKKPSTGRIYNAETQRVTDLVIQWEKSKVVYIFVFFQNAFASSRYNQYSSTAAAVKERKNRLIVAINPIEQNERKTEKNCPSQKFSLLLFYMGLRKIKMTEGIFLTLLVGNIVMRVSFTLFIAGFISNTFQCITANISCGIPMLGKCTLYVRLPKYFLDGTLCKLICKFNIVKILRDCFL